MTSSVRWRSFTFDVHVSGEPVTDLAMLSYDPQLGRVRIDVTEADPPPDSTALVERSTDQKHWTVIRGGDKAPADRGSGIVDDYEFSTGVRNFYRVTLYSGPSPVHTYTDDIVPAVEKVWLKNLAFPFLNRPVVVQDYGDVTRPARGKTHDVVGAIDPVAVTDVRGSRSYELKVLTADHAEADTLDQALSPGGVVYVQTPEGEIPDGHYRVGDTTQARPFRKRAHRMFTLPLTKVRPPSASMVGATMTCRALTNRYDTCQDLLDTGMSCAEVLDLVADPKDWAP